jgi:hypothetical protein
MFRTQDLVISALPQAQAAALRLCLWGTRICIRPTIHCGFPTLLTCWRWTWITCWQWTPCPFATCYGFTCLNATCPGRTLDCHLGSQGPGCPGGSVFDPGLLADVINPGAIVINEVSDIRALRGQLQDVMEQLGDLEKRGLDAGMHSAEELEQMETHLKKALEEVQSQRKQGKGK